MGFSLSDGLGAASFGALGYLSGSTGGGGPNGTNYLGVRYGAKDYASQTQALLSRQQFNDFLFNYLPIEKEQIYQATSDGVLNDQRQDARVNAATSLDRAADARDMSFRSFGVTPSADQSAVFKKSDQISGALADVDAFNRTTQQFRDRQFAALSGSQNPLSNANQQQR